MIWTSFVLIHTSVGLASECTLSCKSDYFFPTQTSFYRSLNLTWRQLYLLYQYIVHNLIMLLFVHSNRGCGVSHLKFNTYLGLISTEFYYFIAERQRTFLDFCFRAEKRTSFNMKHFSSISHHASSRSPLSFLFCPSLPQKKSPFPEFSFTVPDMSHHIHKIRCFRRRQKNPNLC